MSVHVGVESMIISLPTWRPISQSSRYIVRSWVGAKPGGPFVRSGKISNMGTWFLVPSMVQRALVISIFQLIVEILEIHILVFGATRR
jgi:hypothetical protein